MTDQSKQANPSNQVDKDRPQPEEERRTAGGVDEMEPEEQGFDEESEPQPGGGRHSESEKPNSPDSRWGSGKDRRG